MLLKTYHYNMLGEDTGTAASYSIVKEMIVWVSILMVIHLFFNITKGVIFCKVVGNGLVKCS